MSLPRIILFATDFSPSCDQAWEAACQLARAGGAQLIVLHVIPPQVTGYEKSVLQGLPISQYREQAERALHKYHCADVPLSRRLVEGEAADTIVRVAKESGADCIVLGSHGYGLLTRILLGSVAEKVLRKAPCLVLVVRSQLATHPT